MYFKCQKNSTLKRITCKTFNSCSDNAYIFSMECISDVFLCIFRVFCCISDAFRCISVFIYTGVIPMLNHSITAWICTLNNQVIK